MPGGLEKRRAIALREIPTAANIPWGSLLTPTVALLGGGGAASTWELGGIPFETASPDTIAARHEALCAWLASLNERFSVWMHRIQRYEHVSLEPIAGTGYAARLDQAWRERLHERPFLTNRIFVTLVLRQELPRMGLFAGAARSREEVAAAHAAIAEEMGQRAVALERMLHEFEPRALGEYDGPGGVRFTRLGSFAAMLATGQWTPVRAGPTPLRQRIGSVRPFAHNGIVELRGIQSTRFAAMLDVLDFGGGECEPGFLDGPLYEGIEYIETISFSPMNLRKALSSIETQQNQLSNAGDRAQEQIAELDLAANDVAAGRGKWGVFHYSLAALADTLHDARRNAAKLASAITEDTGFQLAAIDLLTDDAWWAQSPGNGDRRARKAEGSSRVVAALASAHCFWHGKDCGNPWGPPLLKGKTLSGQEINVSFHASPKDEDSTGKKLAAVTLVTGQTRRGKTVTVGALLAMTRRYDPAPRLFVFDKDCSNEILVRAMGGQYQRLLAGTPTGIAPLQWEPTPQHVAFWVELVKALVFDAACPLEPADKKDIERAVAAVARLDRQERSLSAVWQMLPVTGSRGAGNTVRARLERWTMGNALGWVFDEADDAMPADAEVAGWDYTEFLKLPELRVPILMALLQWIEDRIDGRRLVCVLEEAWKALDDPRLAAFAHDKAKTIGKQDGLLVFTTQEPGDLRNDAVGDTLIGQAATILSLYDDQARRAQYIDVLGLTEEEFQTVRTMGVRGGRHFLYKQGPNSVVVDFDLTGLEEHLVVLGGTTDNVALLDEIRAEVGDDPDDWLPILLQRVQERVQRNRKLRRAA